VNHQSELKKLALAWAKYRRMQARLVKLRNSKASPDNVPKVKALLANIAGHTRDTDEMTKRILLELKAPTGYPAGFKWPETDVDGLVN